MTKLVSPAPDAVSEVLRSFAVRSAVLCVSELRAPWAFRVAGEPAAKFHLILDGSALLLTASKKVALAEGDLAILPNGSEHTLTDGYEVDAPPLAQILANHASANGKRLRYGGEGNPTRLFCGGFTLSDGTPETTLARFPEVLRAPPDPAFEPLLASLRAETEGERPGAEAVVTKLIDSFITQALRTWLLTDEEHQIADPRLFLDDAIAKALDLLNRGASEPWSLKRLAREVGLSRSALATKFGEQVGRPPMRYLSEVRLRAAARQLETGRLTLREVARGAGYANEAAFAKAFKRYFGSSPGAYRGGVNKPPRIEIATIR